MKPVDRCGLWAGLLAVSGALAGCGGASQTPPPAAAGPEDAWVAPASLGNRGPAGAGADVTGGAGGMTVRVGTPAQLRHELCRSAPAGACIDDTPRIIEIATEIDLGDAAGRGLPVGSNKTVLGIGANAAVKGKGFVLQNGAGNVVIRNLSITDATDAVTIADARRVWIDHNRFTRIACRFIVTGTADHFGAASEVTISWNEFDGNRAGSVRCDDRPGWMLLLQGNGRLSFANNWLHDFSGRGPRVEGDALLHVVNNHFQDGAWEALDTVGRTTHVLVEGNYFENVSLPLARRADAAPVFALLAQTPAARAGCRAALGRDCAPNIANPVSATNRFTEDAAVLDAAKAAPPGSIVLPAPADRVPALVSAGVGIGHIR